MLKTEKKGKRFHIPADPMRVELDEIKARQQQRKHAGIPGTVKKTNLYQMLSDILENQARIENKLNQLLSSR